MSVKGWHRFMPVLPWKFLRKPYIFGGFFFFINPAIRNVLYFKKTFKKNDYDP
jgi:hypothetical protein